MADAPRSSFIPKQAKTAVSSRVQKKRRFNVLGFISTVLLLASLVFAGGTYFYKDYLAAQLTEEKQALAAERQRFNEGDIASVRELDRQFAAANYLLSNHISPSKVFDTLELTTKESVQFRNFSFSQLPEGDISLTVLGATEEFKSVALQSLEFGKDPLLRNVVFTGLSDRETASVDDAGNLEEEESEDTTPRVSFNVTGNVTPSLLAYDGTEPVTETIEEDSSEVDESFETGTTTPTTTDAVGDDESVTEAETE